MTPEIAATVRKLRAEAKEARQYASIVAADADLKGPGWAGYDAEMSMRREALKRARAKDDEVARLKAEHDG